VYRLSLVGLNSAGTLSFGVLMPKQKSTIDHVTTESRTAKSPMIDRTCQHNAILTSHHRINPTISWRK